MIPDALVSAPPSSAVKSPREMEPPSKPAEVISVRVTNWNSPAARSVDVVASVPETEKSEAPHIFWLTFMMPPMPKTRRAPLPPESIPQTPRLKVPSRMMSLLLKSTCERERAEPAPMVTFPVQRVPPTVTLLLPVTVMLPPSDVSTMEPLRVMVPVLLKITSGPWLLPRAGTPLLQLSALPSS